MRLASALLSPAYEFLTLRRAEQTVRGYVPDARAQAQAYVRAGDARAVAARRSAQALPAALLFLEALRLYLRSAELARSSPGSQERASTTAEGLASALAPVPADPASREPPLADDSRVRSALLSADALYLDRLPGDEIDRTRWALDRACGAARRAVEVRSLTHLRGLRWGRLAAVVLVAAYVVFAGLLAKYGPVDVARGKPVHASSHYPGSPDGQGLVGGEVGTSYAIATNSEDNPYVFVDLQGEYVVDKIEVYNRVDGWFDECLPLALELSTDGTHYEELARRTQHFEAWVVPVHGRLARFVRLRVMRRAVLALSEVAVFGHPKHAP